MDETKISWYRPAAARAIKEGAKQKLDDLSIHPLIPILFDFPFVGKTPYLDVYEFFSVEPVHVLHVGVSKMLKESTSVCLRSATVKTDCYIYVQRSECTFASLRTAIITQVNKFVEQATRQKDTVQIPLYVRNNKGRVGLNGVFTDGDIDGMLEAAYIKKMDMVSPFIGGLINRICGEPETCPVKTVFTEYVDVLNNVCGRNVRKKWTASDIATLRRDIAQFKANGVDVFSAYQKSEIGTVKWHMLYYVADDIIRNRGLQLCNAGLYQYSHTIFKKSYA